MGKYIMALLFLSNIITSIVSAKTIAADIISVDRLREIQTEGNKDYILVDVSPVEQYNIGHISGSINIPQGDIKARSPELPLDKIIITYCHCGAEAESAKAAAEDLLSIGFKNVSFLGSPENAYKKYKESGYPVIMSTMTHTAERVPSDVIVSTADVEDAVLPVAPEIVYSRMVNHPEELGKNFIVMDVRKKSSFTKSHIQGALNFSLGSSDKYENVPKGKEIFVYSDSDKSSATAVKKLKKQGLISVYYIEGGINSWNKKGYNK